MSGQTVNVAVLAETSKFVSGFSNAGKEATGFGSKLSKVALVGAAAVAGVGLAVGKFIKDSIDAAANSEKVAAQTNAVVKSTGGAAGRSADQIGDLALKLSELTGVDDEVVQGGENIIATFTNIKGKQFDETTKAALDLSQAMGTDVNSAAQTLGKALNDPTAGLSKLTKQGVTFTQQQKDQIATMQKAGDVAGAQGIILAEVNKEFGGSAEAFGGTLEGIKAKIGNAFGNIQETIGGAFLPALKAGGSKLAGFLQRLGDSDKFQAFIQQIADFLSTLLSGKSGLGDFIGTLVKAASAASPLGNVLKFVGDNADKVGPILGTVAKVISGVLAAALPIVVQLIGALAKTFAAILPAVAQLAQTLGGALVQVILALSPLLILIAQALGQLLPVLVPLIVALLQLVTPIIALIGPLLTPLIQLLVLLLGPILKLASGLLSILIPAITFLVQAFTAVVSFLAGKGSPALVAFGKLLSGAFTATIRGLGIAWSAVWGGIKNVFMLYVNSIRVAVSALVGFFSAVWAGIVKGVTGFGNSVGKGIGVVVGIVKGIPGKILAGLGNLGNLLGGAGRQIIDGLVNSIKGSLGGVFSVASDIGKTLLNSVKSTLGIHSPSRETGKLATFAIQGFARKLGNLAPIKKAMKLVSAVVIDGFDPGDPPDPFNGFGPRGGFPPFGGFGDDPGALSSSGSLRGGNQYVIHLSTLNPTPEVGRLVVNAINDYNRVNGARA